MSLPEFLHPRMISWSQMFWAIVPLCLVVSIIYKTVRVHHVRTLWREAPYMFFQIIAGLVALGLAAYLVVSYWP